MQEIPISSLSILVNVLLIFGRRSTGFTFENLIKIIYIRKTAHFGNLRNTEIICAYEIFCIFNFQAREIFVRCQSETAFEKIIKASAREKTLRAATVRQSFSEK